MFRTHNLFDKVLIANRGEIAVRIAKTCRRLGIKTVAVYSDADQHALHVRVCDEAYRIGPAAANQSYLCIDAVIQAAQKSGAQAVHPGYGFLSENADFAAACEKSGLVFIGPSADAIRLMGSKSAAKTLLAQSKVPQLPGYHAEAQQIEQLRIEAEKIGYPLLIKATMGGGGKGIRIVNTPAELAQAVASCQREAQSSFGNPSVLLEKYLPLSRHIEIQIFADHSGNCVYLFDRDCSVQRRHQKVIEEAPAPNLSDDMRRQMGEAATLVAEKVNYLGAGTVEFIAALNSKFEVQAFYFMEMNTRLQVEHPVTEMITGLDLVEWQLRIAKGEKLPLTQEKITRSGHALEVRVYAENPQNHFLPSTGKLQLLDLPKEREHKQLNAQKSEIVRVDCGVTQADEITPFYDPMIAKIITWSENRGRALELMQSALRETKIIGVQSNIEFLSRVLDHPAFQKLQFASSFIDTHTDILCRTEVSTDPLLLALLSYFWITLETGVLLESAPQQVRPWLNHAGWSTSGPLKRTLTFKQRLASPENSTEPIRVVFDYKKNTFHFNNQSIECALQVKGPFISGFVNQLPVHAHIYVDQHDARLLHVFYEGRHFLMDHIDPLSKPLEETSSRGLLCAPMPGKIAHINTHLDALVKAGDRLLTIEAMKMEHTLLAPSDGIVKSINCELGSQVKEGVELIEIQAHVTKN